MNEFVWPCQSTRRVLCSAEHSWCGLNIVLGFGHLMIKKHVQNVMFYVGQTLLSQPFLSADPFQTQESCKLKSGSRRSNPYDQCRVSSKAEVAVMRIHSCTYQHLCETRARGIISIASDAPVAVCCLCREGRRH